MPGRGQGTGVRTRFCAPVSDASGLSQVSTQMHKNSGLGQLETFPERSQVPGA